ncbi:MAG: sulfite exporter TauE/SafE family protein [Phycisphaerales bacterium]|nr:sulfite exporter TauE/SafE family protein [Phycisphaerales bacterium]
MPLPQIPPHLAPWVYYLCVGLAVLIVGISKAGFGGGVGILAIPLMALVVGADKMLGMILPLLIACDIFSNLHYLGEYDWPRLRRLIVGALVGVVAGTIILKLLRGMPPTGYGRAMNLIIGIICLAVVAMHAWRLTGFDLPTLPSHPASAITVGVIAGTVSTINNSAGPIVTVYLLHEKLPKRMMMGTLLLYFLIINCTKVPTYVAYGFISRQTLHDSIWFVPLIPIGTLMGAWMNRRVPEKPFAAVLYIAAAVAAGAMIYKAVA